MTQKYIHLLLPLSRLSEFQPYGAEKHGLSIRIPLSHVRAPQFQPYLPWIARKPIIPIEMDMIPGTSWGANLHNLFTARSWNSLRQAHFESIGHACEFCGRATDLECHEGWQYHEPTVVHPGGDFVFGVQKLTKLWGLCKACHATCHLGLAAVEGRLDQALSRLCQLNRWTREQGDHFFKTQMDTHRRRSSMAWGLDLSLVQSFPPLSIQKKWTFIDDEKIILMARQKNFNGRGEISIYTYICGIDWLSHDKQLQHGMSTELAYSHLHQ